jgi:carboxymethylenebutenolidase
MKNRLLSIVCVLLTAVSLRAQPQDWTKPRLDGNSPRHQEWVKIPNGKRQVQSFITYPEVKDKATAVIVIHEIFGMSDWVRSVTDRLAEAGYIAIAPDLLSGAAPNGGGTSDLPASAVGKAIQALPPDQITGDLNALYDYVSKLPACNGKVVVVGFCWGGGQSFRYATNNKNIKAALVFYGTPPPDESLPSIACPVYGFYAGNDARVSATVPKATEAMKSAGKVYEPVIYDGAGHGFMRAGEDPADAARGAIHAANVKAHDESWDRWLALMKKI